MAKLARALPALTIVALAACREEGPTAKPMGKVSASAKAAQTPTVQVFKVKFDPMNNSGVSAEATLTMRDGDLTVGLNAVGRIPQQIHPQHIHGFDTQASACPTLANDTNGDGIITFAEGSRSSVLYRWTCNRIPHARTPPVRRTTARRSSRTTFRSRRRS